MIACLVALIAVSATASDFSTSTLVSSSPRVYPFDTVEYTATVRNSGQSAPNFLQIACPIPVSAMYVASSPEWTFDPKEREVSWYGQLPPGATKVLELTVVAMPETEGNLLAARVPIRYDGNEWNLHHSVDVDTRPATDGVRVGGFRITGCGLAVLGFAGVFGVAMLFARRGPRAAAVMWIFVSLGFLVIFIWIAREDARIVRSYRETRCTVLDSLATFESTSSTSTRPGQRRKDSVNWKAVFAVRHGDVVTVAGESPSTLRVGGGSKATREALQKLTVGSNASCFVDPANPQRVVMTREIGGAYGFALIPLLGLALGLWLWRRKV